MGIVHPDGKTDLTFFVRGKTHRDHIVRITRQVLARISHAIRLINDLGQRIVKIQLPAVIDRTPGIIPSGSPEINKNIAEILVCAAFGGTAGPERFVVELNPVRRAIRRKSSRRCVRYRQATPRSSSLSPDGYTTVPV